MQMKKITLALIAATAYPWTMAMAQNEKTAPQPPTTLQGWAQQLEKFGKGIPQEEAFVHMDNTCYFLGDTLYYKAYLRRSDTGMPSGVSNLMYVELLTPDGYLVERQKIKMTAGQGIGSFVLPDTLYGGYYELRAYTKWQLNWGEHQHRHTKNAEAWFFSKQMAKEYYRDWDKLYSRVFPVYDKPKEPGEYYEDMTTRPMQRMVKTDDTPHATLGFYPEGGDMVAGTRCRIAFEANDAEGQHLVGTLNVKNRKGQTVATARTESRGRGAFELECLADEKYTAEFEWDGRTARKDLPQVQTEGAAMQVTQTAQGLQVVVNATGQAAGEALGITAMCHGVPVDCQQLGQGKTRSTLIPADKLPTGVVQITLYNEQGRVYADRMAFVRKDDFQPQNITFGNIQEAPYEPYAPITVRVNGEPGSYLSVAVRDAAHTDYTYDNGNIMTEMLLCSQIRGFVEQPEYYFEANDQEHQRALDLLMMVQGWRRYNWVTMATPGAFSINYMYEQSEILNGQVSKYTAKDQVDAFRSQLQEWLDEMENASSSMDEEPSEGAEESADDRLSSMINDMNANAAAIMSNNGTTNRANASVSREMFHENEGNLKHEVRVHVELTQPSVEGEGGFESTSDLTTSRNGMFQVKLPAFEQGSYFFLAASDTTKWNSQEKKNYHWVERGYDNNDKLNYPEFYVKLNYSFPRFVKPYTWYQQTPAPVPEGSAIKSEYGNGGGMLKELKVSTKRTRMRSFDKNNPAYVIDAYQAFNDVCDAGFCDGYYNGAEMFMFQIARNYIGDMNMERAYKLEARYNGKNLSALQSTGVLNKYNLLKNLDKVYIYTDYSPRLEGNARYSGDNQPVVTVDVHRYEDESYRKTWRDRRYIMWGYSVCEDFYQPDYSKQKPQARSDYRRTLYWHPYVKLDENGQAMLQFYNNGGKTQISVSAEGITMQGALQTGHSNPEDRK